MTGNADYSGLIERLRADFSELGDEAADALEAAERVIADERAGAEILDEAGMDANDKLCVLANLVIDLRLATPEGQKVKAYARYALSQGPNPLDRHATQRQGGTDT